MQSPNWSVSKPSSEPKPSAEEAPGPVSSSFLVERLQMPGEQEGSSRDPIYVQLGPQRARETEKVAWSEASPVSVPSPCSPGCVTSGELLSFSGSPLSHL